MDWHTLLSLLPLICLPLGYLMKIGVLDRITALEEQSATHLDDMQVRQLLTDKLEPIQNSLDELKSSVSEIRSLLMKKE